MTSTRILRNLTSDDGCDYFGWFSLEEGISLMLTNGQKSWRTQLTDDILCDMAHKVNMTPADYKKETVDALSGDALGIYRYHCTVEVSDTRDNVILTWKRLCGDIKVKMGQIELEIALSASITELLSHFVDNEKKMQDKVISLEQENNRLFLERKLALKKYEDSVSEIEHMESDLFSKFVAILNDKKAKIKELRQQLEGKVIEQKDETCISGNTKASCESVTESETNEALISEPSTKKPKSETASDEHLVLKSTEMESPALHPGRRRRQTKTTPATHSSVVLPKIKSSDPKRMLRTNLSPKTDTEEVTLDINSHDLLGEL